ncbi:unnamed protein product [Rangifer tarandus platyrhynchus]|uniref:Protein FAM24A n=2 Tax=Rangifer tarandus platyrhynchus TaxID=3082113 RepID=A0ABN8ZWG1_RANTA|nr:unnamed protein product [Rangifer tarandus platyrhynchus]
MILERLDFKIMITVAGGLLMAASLLMCFIICLSYKVAKSVKEEKTVRMANTPLTPNPQMGSWGSCLSGVIPGPVATPWVRSGTAGGFERTEVGRVESGFLPLPIWGCELTNGVFSAAGSALLCRPLASPGSPSAG